LTWQLSWVYQYQTGPATTWSNRFCYGDNGGGIPSGFQGFDGRSASQPGTFHERVFPTRLDALRSDPIRMWHVKILRRFRIREGWNSTLSVDLMNTTNHGMFEAPETDPTNTNFGRVTAQLGLSRRIRRSTGAWISDV
jgi:hypothetical protein